MDNSNYTKQNTILSKFNKNSYSSFKINSVKSSANPNIISNQFKPYNYNGNRPVASGNPVSLFRLPQIPNLTSNQKLDLQKLNLKRKKYKKDSNSSLSNCSCFHSDNSKSLHQSDYNNYETTTTTEDPKLMNKISIFFEIEKSTILIQRVYRGFVIRARIKSIKLLKESKLNSKKQYSGRESLLQLPSGRSEVSCVSINSYELNFSEDEDLDDEEEEEEEYYNNNIEMNDD